jgi:transposase
VIYYGGIDVSLEQSSVCVVDGDGRIVREGKVASEPEALIGWFGSLGLALTRVGLEAGPLSQWLYAALKEARLAVELLETRHVRDAFKAMPVKTDRKDARGIAAADAAGLVSAGALQECGGAGGPCAADGAQAGAVEAV